MSKEEEVLVGDLRGLILIQGVILSVLFFIPGILLHLSFPYLISLYLIFFLFSYLSGVFDTQFPPFYGLNLRTQVLFFLAIGISFLIKKTFTLNTTLPLPFWVIFWFYLALFEPGLSLIFSRKRKIPVLLVWDKKTNPKPKVLPECDFSSQEIIMVEDLANYLNKAADPLGRIKKFPAVVIYSKKISASQIRDLAKRYLSDFYLLKSFSLTNYFLGQRMRRITSLSRLSLSLRLKRIIDIILSLLLLTLFSPLLLFFALCIKLDSPGSVFYRHKRIGRNGRSFYLLKFRTMFQDADKRLASVLAANPRLREEFQQIYKLKNDPRVTAIGRVFRHYSLDEIPQLINVLKGEMSLVGPRPIVEEEIGYYQNASILPFKFFPGVTGLWQISGRTDTTYEKRVRLAEKYCQEWNLWRDIKILFKTIPAVLSKKGAY